jgi:hypothetical protein
LQQDSHILERYKAQIKKYLAPHEPWKESQQISSKKAKKVLSDYKKATNDKIGLIDLMVHYVECGTNFLCEYGDMYEQYYISLESVFDNVTSARYKDVFLDDMLIERDMSFVRFEDIGTQSSQDMGQKVVRGSMTGML